MKKSSLKAFKLGIFSFSMLISAAFSFTTAAQPSIDVGPDIGSQMPELVVLDETGVPQKLGDVMGKKGAIIVFFRSADWCPFCKTHLKELNQEVQSLYNLGFGVSAISYDPPKVLKHFSQMEKLKFSLLSDQNVETFKALNIVNKMYKSGDRHYGIPYPGVIVINSDGKVIHKYFYEGYKKRVMFKLLLKDLE